MDQFTEEVRINNLVVPSHLEFFTFFFTARRMVSKIKKPVDKTVTVLIYLYKDT